jgi:hypothetical protein
MVQPVLEPHVSNRHAEFRSVGEVRQTLLTGRVFLPEDDVPLRTM